MSLYEKMLSLVLCVILAYVIGNTSVAVIASEESRMLSLMSESECVEFVKEHGVQLPPIYEHESQWGPFVKQIISIVEETPDAPIMISNSTKRAVAEEIRTVVKMYYGLIQERTIQQVFNTTPNSEASKLEKSAYYASWDESFEDYNCYGFAIGQTNAFVDPGFWDCAINNPQQMPYNMSIPSYDVRGIAGLVISDLVALGKERINSEDSQMDTSNLCVNEEIICVRGGSQDYHFMKYAADGWLHKPSNSQILRYLYTPTDEEPWNNEALYRNKYEEPTLSYEGLIIFISYNGHDWSYAINNNMTHTKTCSICDDVIQCDCHLTYTYAGDSLHNGSCTECNNSINGVYCNYRYTSNGNGTHKRECTLSDHETPNAACTYTYSATENGTHVATCVYCDYSIVRGCTMVTTYSGNSAHHSECTVCGGEYDEACTAVKTYCGSATLGDVHALACEACGNSMGTATESCTFEYIFTGTINGHNVHSRICRDCDYAKVADAQCMYKNGNLCFLCGHPRNLNSGEILKTGEQIE